MIWASADPLYAHGVNWAVVLIVVARILVAFGACAHMGGVVGLPVFILVTILPLLLVTGWVELYKSNLWTLTYRELRGTERSSQVVQPDAPLSPAAGAAGQ